MARAKAEAAGQTGVDAGADTTIRLVLHRRDFRRLIGTRLLGQFGDGVF